MAPTPTLVTRDVLAALDAAGVRCEIVDTNANCEDRVSKLVELREELADLQRTVSGYGSLVGAAKAFIAEVEAS